MANVKMPNGDVVAFPDDMPKAQIRALIEKKFPNAQRQALADTGKKPYMSDLEAAATTVANVPAQALRSVQDLGLMAAESVTQALAPQVSRGVTPPAKFTPGASVEDYLSQPAAPLYDVKGTGIGQTLPDGTLSPVNLLDLVPKEITYPIARAAAEASLRAQLQSAETAKSIKPLDVNPDSLSGVIAGAAGSTAEMVVPAAASLIMRNPAPLVVYFTTRVLGESYGEARRQGAGVDRARVAAGLKAAAEAATEAIAGKVFVEGGKKLLGTVLKNAGVEGLTEAATEALQALVDVGVLEQDMTLEDAAHRVADAGLIGAIAGGVTSGATYPLRGKEEPEAAAPVAPAVEEGVPVEDLPALPGPQTLLALPSPEAFAPAATARRQPPAPQAPRREETLPPSEDEINYQAKVALQRTKQAETAELLQTARETITPLGTFDVDEIGPVAAGKVRQHRIQMGRPVEAPVTIEDMARAKVPQRQIDAVIATRRPVTSAEALTPLDIMRAADAKNIIPTDTNFAELALRTTGQRNVQRMTQAQLNALKTTLDSMPAHPAPVTVPLAEQSPFTDDQYGKALDAIRQQGRYTATAIREATGLKAAKDVDAIRDAMVRRGQLIERAKGDYRLYDTLGVERQSTPDDLPPGAFKEYTMRRVPVAKVRVTRDGKSVGTFSSAGEARAEVSKIRSKDKAATVKIEPAEETAWGVMENRYDEQGNLLGSVVVDSHRDEAAAQKALEKLNTPADTGARYTQTDVTPTLSTEPVPVRPVRDPMPPAFAGRLTEIVKRLNDQARDRKLPLLGVRVQIKPSIITPEGEAIEGFYLRKIISLTAQNLTPDMSTDQIVERLGQVMDHELIHALRAAGVLGPESDGWKTISRYAKRAKRNGTGETYYDWAQRNYGRPGNPDGPLPGYETRDSIEEEAIAEAFRAWASNRRNVAGKPATVFRQIVEWFKRLIDAVPQEAFKAIETGSMVAEALKPPGGQLPRAKATRQMEAAAAGISEAQKAKDENLVRVRSREYLRAREQARDDRFGKSGPKTVLGTTPAKVYSTGDVGDVAVARALADRYRKQNGVQDSRLMTLLPVDPDYMKRIADAQQRAVHAPGDAAVAKAYRALIDETKAMFQSLGDLEVIAWDGAGAPYDSPASMLADIANGKLTMRLSDDMFGPGADNPGHPLNAASGYKTTDGRVLTNNDLFRVVHDVFGHGQSGFRDDARGAYNAYHEHARLLSPEARRALATETLAQRAWQEFGQHLRRRDGTVPRETDVDYLADKYKEFAEQKAFLLPEDMVSADPGWALADKAADVEETPRFSLAPPVESEAFKNWFGDSKVVDPEGKPLVVYHGSEADFSIFSKTDVKARWVDKARLNGFFFTADPEYGYVKRSSLVYPVYLRVENPFFIERSEFMEGLNAWDNATEYVESLKAKGHDGIIWGDPDNLRRSPRGAWGDDRSQIFVFEPTQIKSATANVGTFDASNPDIRYSRFDDNLPGGRLYGNPERSPGGALSAPGTPTPAFTSDRPGNQFFGGELAEEQLRMVREGDRGAALVYLSPEDFLALAGNPTNPEQEVYDEAVTQGFKLSGFPSLVTSGYAGNVRAVASDSTAGAAALVGRADQIPVVLYPKDGQSLGLVTALEAPDGSRVPWPHDGRAENFPEMRGPRYSVGSEEFRRWFGNSAVVNEDGSPKVVYHGTRQDFNAFEPNIRKTDQLGFGVHFAEDEGFAARYAEDDTVARKGKSPRVIPAFLSVQNPLKADRIVREGEPDFDLARQIAGSKLFTTKDENGVPSVWLQNAIDAGSPARAQAAIREAGYDGVEYESRIGALAPGMRGANISGRSRSFIVFEPTQIKSAIANRGTWDAANPDIRYSLNAPFGTRVPRENNARLLGPSPRYSLNSDEEFDLFGSTTKPRDKAAEAATKQQAEAPRRNYNIVQQKVDGWVGRAVQNIGRSKRSLPIVGSIFDARVKLQDKMLSVKEMIEQIKEAGGNIDDLNDTYMLEQLYHGKVFDQIQQREEDLQVPLLEALRAAHDGPNKVTPTDFEDYLYARHAPERNAYLRARGATDPNPSGMSDAEASSILDRLAIDGKMPDLEVLASMADAIVADTTRTRVDAGLISEEAAASSPYQYYVPLRGFADEELDPGNPGENQTRARSGKGFSVGGREDRTVTGRGRKAGDLLGHLFLQNTEAVIRAQKNEVALSFMRLIQQNENLGFGKILKTAPTRRVVGANGMIHEAGDPSYRQAPDIVTAKWKGKEVIARVTDPRLARAIKSDYVSTSNDLVNALTAIGGKLNRYLATVNTSLNPEFLISNLARDMQTAGILSQQYGIKDFGKKIIGNAPRAMAGIREVLRTGEANSEWAQVFREMQKAGGTTEFLGINDLEQQVRRIRRSITQTGWKTTPRKAMEYLGKVGKFVDDYNKVAENAFRLSAYKAAKEAGASTAQAAFLAKNLTVNFNKGGELKAFMNAYYLFYNASVQGSAVLMNGLKNKRVQKIVAGVVVAGFLQDLLNRALSGDDDENGVTDYDDIPDYVLETNFVLMDPLGILEAFGIKSGYFAIPMPYGFNAFYNTGRNLSAAFSGSPVRNPGKSAVDSLLGFADAFNPLGGVQSIYNFIAPTFADPVVDLITNKDFAGNDIVPERPSFGLPVPDSQKYWSNTEGIPVWVSEHLNRLTGGNEVRAGAVDISPEVLQYGYDFVTGATGKFAQRLGQLGGETIPNAIQGDFSEIEIGDIPFARRVVGSIGSRGNTERYYAVSEEVATIKAELEMYAESGRPEEARRVAAQNPVEVSLIGMFDDASKALQDLRKQLREVRDNENIPAARRKEIVKQIKDQQDLIMQRVNKIYFEQKKAAR